MTNANAKTALEDVLLAFAVEPSHDPATLQRYLKLYPEYAVDLIDLLSELRQPQSARTDVRESEAAARRAWNEFASTVPRAEDVSDPFAAFTGIAFVTLAQSLRVPRSILIALRDRLVIAASIPAPFFARLIRATQSTAETFQHYLDLPPALAPSASYKSDQKPEAPSKVSFELLLENSGITAEQKKDICTSAD